MNVKFITVQKSNLPTVPVVDGQLIFCADENSSYYDMNSTRYLISGNNIVTTLPLKGLSGEIYICTSGDKSGLYIWNKNSRSFDIIADLSKECKILDFIKAKDESKLYLLGLNSENSNPKEQYQVEYSDNAYLDVSTNTIHATNFDGHAKSAETSKESDHATSADSATSANSAKKAEKLDTPNSGSTTKPVYFENGVPVECTFTVESDVPENAVFTDTTYDVFNGSTPTSTGTLGLVPEPTTQDCEKFLKGDGTWSDIDPVQEMVGCVPEDGLDGESGLVPKPKVNDFNRFLKGDGTWSEYSAGSGLELTSLTFSLEETGVVPGIYGPIPDKPGGNVYTGNEIRVPQIEVDKYGRVIKIKEIICKVQGGSSEPLPKPERHFPTLSIDSDGNLVMEYDDQVTLDVNFTLTDGELSAICSDDIDVYIDSDGNVTVQYEE